MSAVPKLRRLVAGFPTRRLGFNPSLGPVEFVVDRVAQRQVFSEYLDFPCQFSFYQMLHTHLSSAAGKIGRLVVDIPSGLKPTPPRRKILSNFTTFLRRLRFIDVQNITAERCIIANNDVARGIKLGLFRISKKVNGKN
jgi:hypothetical protein